jgi:transposase
MGVERDVELPRAYDSQTRERVIRAALAGQSPEQIVAMFGVSKNAAAMWVKRYLSDGERRARTPGRPRVSKLDVHRDYLTALIRAQPEVTITELVTRLREDHGVRVDRSTLWDFLERHDLTILKRRQLLDRERRR